MTAKKKFNFKAPLEVFAKSIVQPMMYLSVAGILLIVGIILTNKTICALVPVLGSGPFQVDLCLLQLSDISGRNVVASHLYRSLDL